MRDEEHQLDALIDEGLSTYAEPPETTAADLAARRIVARVREAERPRRPRRTWILALPLSACLAALVIAAVIRATPSASVPHIAWTPRPPQIALQVAAVPVPRTHEPFVVADISGSNTRARPARYPTRSEEQLPKLAVFPTPRPLTAEEQRLSALASKTPPEVRLALVQAQEHPRDLNTVAAFTIRPLPDLGEQPDFAEEKENRP